MNTEKGWIIPVSDIPDIIESLLKQEDTNKDGKITIKDTGPKSFILSDPNSKAFPPISIKGHYALTNLLQELSIAIETMKATDKFELDLNQIYELPVKRINRFIKDHFWHNLTRSLDKSMLAKATFDEKIKTDNTRRRIYVPHDDEVAYQYFTKASKDASELAIDVVRLPSKVDPPYYIHTLDLNPGILSLALKPNYHCPGISRPLTPIEICDKAYTNFSGYPYCVPGGRFNEIYGWDSYFIILGLLNDGKIELARGTVENLIYEIRHYGRIMNANRTYYLMRSQPPFLTQIALEVFKHIKDEADGMDFLKRAIGAAIKEYETVWTGELRLNAETGLSTYSSDVISIPIETEPTHYKRKLEPYLIKHNLSLDQFVRAYNEGSIKEPELDEYFLHDNALRESGHDTSSRLINLCANLATVDLNCLLYRYECDIATVIKSYFNDKFLSYKGEELSSDIWFERANTRKTTMMNLCWDENKKMFFDYNIKTRCRSNYESATMFYVLWSKLVSEDVAAELVKNALPEFTMNGGLVAGTLSSRNEFAIDDTDCQWDYPYGWAPHQIITWIGLDNYGFVKEKQKLIFKWLNMTIRSFYDHGGVVAEKYNVVTELSDSHHVLAEYGNQGTDFSSVPKEGFGWTNASIQIGIKHLPEHLLRELPALI